VIIEDTMINRTHPISPIAVVSHEVHTGTGQPQRSHPVADAESKTSVTLSNIITQMRSDDSHDVNLARVAELQAALEAGDLPLAADTVAQSMVQHMVSVEQ
jgi:negative regulator of flagellin synthesis FlgM